MQIAACLICNYQIYLPSMLTTTELMRRLKRSRLTILRWVEGGLIPFERRFPKRGKRKGNALLFDAKAVDEAMVKKGLKKGK